MILLSRVKHLKIRQLRRSCCCPCRELAGLSLPLPPVIARRQAGFFGCYVAYLWLRLHRPAWWLLPGALSLVLFARLLTLHPQSGAGRVQAAYGGLHMAALLVWSWSTKASDPAAARATPNI